MNTNYLLRMTLLNLPFDVLQLIFDFEGLAKENYDIFLKKFKNILKSKECHDKMLWFYHDDKMFCRSIVPMYRGNPPIYKYILALQKKVSFCDCDTPCCYIFQYKNTDKYTCGCHEQNNSGSISYIFYVNNKEKISIRTEKEGFCCKTYTIKNI